MLNEKLLPYQIEEIVHSTIVEILSEKKIFDIKIFSDMKLNVELGITSLELARLVSQLENKFGIDPFLENISITSIRTVKDLISAYQQEYRSISH